MEKIDLVAIGIVCLTILESIALFKGINGIMLTAAIGAIMAAIGFVFPSPIKFSNSKV